MINAHLVNLIAALEASIDIHLSTQGNQEASDEWVILMMAHSTYKNSVQMTPEDELEIQEQKRHILDTFGYE